MSANLNLTINSFPSTKPPSVGTIHHTMGGAISDPNVTPDFTNDKISVGPSDTLLEFVLDAASGNPNQYNVVGVAFVDDKTGKREPWTNGKVGRFSELSITGNKVSFVNRVPGAKADKKKYKMFVFVHRDDGIIGVIDPYIENEH